MSADTTQEFRWTVRVYFEDTDAAGVVYYANYLKFFERCRTEWLRALDIEQQVLAERAQLQFVVASLRIDFMRPARLDDAITLSARILKQARSYLVFEQRATRSTDCNEELLATAEVKVACVNRRTLRPAALPETLISALQLPRPGKGKRGPATARTLLAPTPKSRASARAPLQPVKA